MYHVQPNCTWKFKNSQLKLTLWNGTEVRVERIRHAFQTTAPESACKANTVQSTKGQEAPLREHQLWPGGQLAQNTNVVPSCTVTPRLQSQAIICVNRMLWREFENLSTKQGQISLQLRSKRRGLTRNKEEHL